MYKVYFKQAVQMLKQNKFFSIIYIAGTGLAISMVMTLAILYYFHTANIEPESYRDRMMIVQYGKVAKKKGKDKVAVNYRTRPLKNVSTRCKSPKRLRQSYL